MASALAHAGAAVVLTSRSADRAAARGTPGNGAAVSGAVGDGFAAGRAGGHGPAARRAALGLARTGSISGNGSGDIFIAFSTANSGAWKPTGLRHLEMVPNDQMGPLFEATVQATEEAIVNALVAAETMTGAENHTVEAIPHDKLREVLKKYNRLAQAPR